MSRELSDGEDSAAETDEFVDATAETEVELHLPLEVDMEPDRIHEEVPTFPGSADTDAVDPDPGAWRRFESPNGAKPKWLRFGLPGMASRSLDEQFPRAGRQSAGSGDGRR